MEMTPITVFYGSLLGIMLTAILGILYRQGRSSTHNDTREVIHQSEESLRAEMRQMREDFREDMRLMREEFREDMRRMREELRQEMRQVGDELREDMRRMREELRAEIKEAVGAAVREITVEFNRQIDDVNQRIDNVNDRIDDLNQQIAGLRQEISLVLNALSSHSHVDGQVLITVPSDTEPAPVAAN